jgi:hypothetical protein
MARDHDLPPAGISGADPYGDLEKDFRGWGSENVAYVKMVDTPDFEACAIFAADGSLLGIVDTLNHALEYIDHIRFDVATIH